LQGPINISRNTAKTNIGISGHVSQPPGAVAGFYTNLTGGPTTFIGGPSIAISYSCAFSRAMGIRRSNIDATDRSLISLHFKRLLM
jgi:hypothetical protein